MAREALGPRHPEGPAGWSRSQRSALVALVLAAFLLLAWRSGLLGTAASSSAATTTSLSGSSSVSGKPHTPSRTTTATATSTATPRKRRGHRVDCSGLPHRRWLAGDAVPPLVSPGVAVWPQPQTLTSAPSANGTVFLDAATLGFTLHAPSKHARSLVGRAVHRLCRRLFGTNSTATATAPSMGQPSEGAVYVLDVAITVRSGSTKLALGVAENYTLTSVGGNFSVVAETAWGVLHALETLAQLCGREGDSGAVAIAETPLAITDAPAVAWRGFLLDVSRHFYPVEDLLQHLRAMAMSKLSVFHWHLTDYQSFPLESKRFPLLGQRGAWPGQPSHIYTQDDVRRVVKFAYEHGIRVVPEIDIPGHSGSWGLGYPNITSCNRLLDVLNPLNNFTFEVVEALFEEVAGLFLDEHFHTGGDEVNHDCWGDNPTIAAWMKGHHDPHGHKLVQRLVDSAFSVLGRLGRTPVVWQDLVDLNINIPDGTLVQAWQCWAGNDAHCGLERSMARGSTTLQSTCFYLDFESPWQAFYHGAIARGSKCGAFSFNKFAGAEVALWSERISPDNFACRAWPRAAAFAERLWTHGVSDAAPKAAEAGDNGARLLQRLQHHTLRLQLAGTAAEPVPAANATGYCPLLPESESTKSRGHGAHAA